MKFKRWVMLIPIMVAALVATSNPINPSPVSAATTEHPAGYWAFCGPQWATNSYTRDPSFGDPYAWQKAATMANAGIDATHGPCLTPNWSVYSAAFPFGPGNGANGSRYGTRVQQLATLWINSHYCVNNPHPWAAIQPGQPCLRVSTIIYDPDLWSKNATVRNAAVAFWAPHKAYIRAIDMGDEFPCWETNQVYDPLTGYTGTQWDHLVDRANTVWNNITTNPASGLYGIHVYTTHVPLPGTGNPVPPGYNCAQMAHTAHPALRQNLGFDNYHDPNGIYQAWHMSTYYNPPNQVCAVRTDDALDTDGGGPDIAYNTYNLQGVYQAGQSVTNLTETIGKYRHYGCDTMLFFNPGISIWGAPFSDTKSISNNSWPYGLSDWGNGLIIAKNYSTP